MLTIRQLEIFVEVVRAGSFRQCGEKLGMSQVSVSEHIRTLEQRLGAELFQRKPGRSPELTPNGLAAHTRILDILAAIEDLKTEMSGQAGDDRRRLKIGVHSFLMRDLPSLFAKFMAEHDHAEIVADSALHSPAELIDMVTARTLDLAYFFELDDIARTQFVREEPLAVFVSADHPFASKRLVSMDELATIAAIQLTDADPLHRLVDRAFASVGLRNRKIALETDEFGLILASLRRGLGYACLFEASFDESSNNFGLHRLTLERPLPALQVRLAARPMAHQDALLMELSEALAETWRANDRT